MKHTLYFGLFVLFFLGFFSVNVQGLDNRGYKVKIGDKAPDFSIQLTNNKVLKISNLRGKIIMLQFTASWCSVCRKEMPFIESDIWQKHKNNPDFALIAIDRDEPLETVEKFASSMKITYPIGLDPAANIFSKYAEKDAGITRNVIIDKSGNIVMLTRLYNEAEFEAMKTKIESLLKQ